MKQNFWIASALLLAILLTAVACVSRNNPVSDETTQPAVNLDTADSYDYGQLNCDNNEFTFLQCDEDRWGMKTALAPEQFTGDDISDAVFRRNNVIETLYNVSIQCINKDIYETGDYVRTQCLTREKTVDAAYVIGSDVATLISEKHLLDFSEIPNIQIYENWWNQKIREASQFGGSSALYYTQSDISVTAFELTWCIAVNLDMIKTNQMEVPYDLVKKDQWTMEKMFEMMRGGMKANSSDGTFTYSEDTDCIVGFTTYDNFTAAAINGSDCFMVKKDDIGNPAFTGEGERFIYVVEKWANAFHTTGMAIEANETGYHYEKIFADQRALFAGVEIKATSTYKQLYLNYGILPVPKFDEDQKGYYSNVNYLAPVLVIPNTNTEMEKTGRILDTMAYMSYKNILPVYYERNLSLKALNDPESVEMLDIIRDTRCFETGLLYGWITSSEKNGFYDDIKDIVMDAIPRTNIASAIATHRSAIVARINNYLSVIE